MQTQKTVRYGFQLIEIIIASCILGIVVGSVIYISISAAKGTRRSADTMLCISLARHVMEQVLSQGFDNIDSDSEIHDVFEDSSRGRKSGPLFQQFEVQNMQAMPINEQFDIKLFEQLKSLNVRYQVLVSDLYASPDCKQIMVTIFWDNNFNTMQYNLTSFIARRISG